MQLPLLDKLTTLLHSLAGGVLVYVLPAAIAVVALWIVWRLFRRKRLAVARLPANLTVDVESLGDQGPPDGPPVLEFYNLPVRLAAVVLAPAGLGRELPSDAQIGHLLDAMIPGLDKVAELHRPLIRRWPNQLSTTGFAHLFFSSAKLPGTGGKGTPWSSAAGSCKFLGKPVMIGLVLRAAKPNSLGQTIIEAEHQWLGCLRVRWN
jgi:hypothetical protein